MQQSRFYILMYAAGLTIVCGGLLGITSIGLKDRQMANVELERKENILSTVMTVNPDDDIQKLYSEKVNAFVINFKGDKVEGADPASIDVGVEYKKAKEDRLLPVYEFVDASGSTEFVVLPVYGYGLWNSIWGFIALKADMNTVQGVKFQHLGETPGLGARITEPELQARFKDKTVFDGQELASILMQKGEGYDYSSEQHKVDGMSGATLTGKGVNNMLLEYFECYKNYLLQNKKTNS